jgi:hypothetical protein
MLQQMFRTFEKDMISRNKVAWVKDDCGTTTRLAGRFGRETTKDEDESETTQLKTTHVKDVCEDDKSNIVKDDS